ncbi:MAG: DUF1559 domain-containing protein [Planctomycetes bacterium]|nr:DUF1559 domain-containing protein [Planctomycetota bacterium]
MHRLHLHRSSIVSVLLLFAASVAGRSFAQDGGPAARVAPFLDPQAAVVMRIDLGALAKTLEPAQQQFSEFIGEDEREQLRAALAEVASSISGLQKLGANEIFAVYSLADAPQRGPFIVVPGVRDAPNKDRLPAALSQFEACETLHGALVCGPQAILDRLKELRPGQRTFPAEAFAAAADDPVAIVLSPGDDQRRVFREMGPELPAEWGGLTGEILADGVSWAAVGIALAPQVRVRLVVQSQDAAAAAKLQAAIGGGLTALAKRPEVEQVLPAALARSLARGLTPKRDDRQLTLEVSADNPLVRMGALQLLAATGKLRAAAQRNEARDNFKRFGLALHNFHDVYGSFPPTASYDADGSKLLSWRVFVLPYLGEDALYRQFRLDEPWDSEHNKTLIEKMPEVFAAPAAGGASSGKTAILAPVGDSLVFTGGAEGVPLQGITDGSSQTILLLEAPTDKVVVWTKPEDWPVDLEQPAKGLFPEGREHAQFLYADGSVRTLPRTIDPTTLRALFTRAGGEPALEK